MTHPLRLAGRDTPLSVKNEHLVVHGRDGRVRRLRLTGDGGAVALAPYRYTTSWQSGRRFTGVTTEPGVATDAGWREPSQRPVNEAGLFAGVAAEKEWQRTIEWGTAVLDRNGTVLLRMQSLRGVRKMRRIAEAFGLEFTEEQVTDPERLRPAPVLAVGSLLGARAERLLNAVGVALAVGTAVAVAAAVGGGGVADLDFGALAAGFITYVFVALPFRWLLRWIGDMVALR